MNKPIDHVPRKSYIEIGEIYFWTATIKDWNHLLKEDEYKQIIVDSFDYLKGKFDVFAFVIMPNHIHVILRVNEYNGKEKPHVSFMKFTAHQFKKRLQKKSPEELLKYQVDKTNKAYEFWQADSLAVNLYSRDVAYQKLDYLHLNPLQEHWSLVERPEEYTFSSAPYYELGNGRFRFLKDLREEY